MKKKNYRSYQLALVGLLLLLQYSCAICSAKRTARGNVIPKKFKDWYVTKAEDLYPKDLIDTTAIYYTCHDPAIYDPPKCYFHRFFADGKLYSSTALDSDSLNNEVANNMVDGYTGYYLIKDGELIIKTYDYAYCGFYIIEWAKIFEDRIVIYKAGTSSSIEHDYYPNSSSAEEINRVYYKLDVGELYSQPDW
ncbi:hypothetical protein PPO43_12830 [Saprospira sp. CCB-QB6]|uniref:hypothetical protein n=1 Tax=Saprospira sp. CCB-QB6 TaxID=3023936 RepID=UPI00234B60BC|nr:hypothetical protein [Saprospira sp. CCB-QB6]WCL80857.1 hypothetical protein PPO43_12830 [Saprospira sp. CCB-QB6]